MATRRFPVKLAPLAGLILSMGSLLPVYASGMEATVSPPVLLPVAAAPPTNAPVAMPPMTRMPAMPIMLAPQMMAPGATGGAMPPGFPGWPAMPYPVWVPMPMNWLTVPARGTPPDVHTLQGARPSGGLGAAPAMTAPVSASPAQSVMPAPATSASVSGSAETGTATQSTAPPGPARESVSPQTRSGTEVTEPVLPIAPAATVGYGPLSPSPVIVLPAIEAESASQPKATDGKPSQKKTRKPKSGNTQETPKKNRYCWSNGKVAPCGGGATSQFHNRNRVNSAP